ncbi:MAG: hypothetical protein GXO14_03180 [Thermococci archaeon]|nr:hypothetical protein [Thermococci archaeon]
MVEDILLPCERRDSVVLVGVDRRSESVEFIRVYAVDEETAKATLEEFMNAKGLFPVDYVVVGAGPADVSEKSAITTRSEAELSSALSRLGLRLLSNGVLYTEGRERLYQITLVSESLYAELKAMAEGREGDATPSSS